MKYPGIEFFNDGIKMDTIPKSVDAVSKCISQIINGEDVYNRSDMTDEEIREWIESLTKAQFSKIIEFFITMPRLKHEFKLKNTNTKKDFTITLEGLADFF